MTLLWFVSREKLLQLPKKVPCQIPLEGAFDFPVAEPLGCAALHVFLGGFIEAHAGLDDHIQGHVQLPVAVAVEPVPSGVSRGGLQG